MPKAQDENCGCCESSIGYIPCGNPFLSGFPDPSCVNVKVEHYDNGDPNYNPAMFQWPDLIGTWDVPLVGTSGLPGGDRDGRLEGFYDRGLYPTTQDRISVKIECVSTNINLEVTLAPGFNTFARSILCSGTPASVCGSCGGSGSVCDSFDLVADPFYWAITWRTAQLLLSQGGGQVRYTMVFTEGSC